MSSREYNRKYWQEHKDELNARHREYYKKHKRKMNEQNREYQKKNKKNINASHRLYYLAKPYKRKRRGRESIEGRRKQNALAEALRRVYENAQSSRETLLRDIRTIKERINEYEKEI